MCITNVHHTVSWSLSMMRWTSRFTTLLRIFFLDFPTSPSLIFRALTTYSWPILNLDKKPLDLKKGERERTNPSLLFSLHKTPTWSCYQLFVCVCTSNTFFQRRREGGELPMEGREIRAHFVTSSDFPRNLLFLLVISPLSIKVLQDGWAKTWNSFFFQNRCGKTACVLHTKKNCY